MTAVQTPILKTISKVLTNPSAAGSSSDGEKPTWRGRRALFVLFTAVTMLYGAGLGRIDFWAPDEPRYGAIAEELRSFRHGASGLVLLHLNDAPYTQKPPLYFWLAAAFGAPLGRVDEWAARLPSALAGLLCVGLTAWIGRRLFHNRTSAIMAAGMLATSFRFAFTARRAQLDIVLTAFELAAIALFLFLETQRGGIANARRFPLAIVALHACLGAAALTKGPVGWLPMLVFAGYLAWEGRLASLRAITPAWSWLLSAGPITAWILAAITLAPPGFAKIAVGENLIGRFFSGTSHARPFYYFAIQLPLDFMPWSLLLPFAIPALWRFSRATHDQTMKPGADPDRSAARFLLSWLIVPLVFFSLSTGKRGLYLLPIFPALALACVAIGPSSLRLGRLANKTLRRLALVLCAVASIEFALFTLALPRLNSEKSPRPIALAATRNTAPNEAVGVFGLSPLEGGIAYYGKRPVISLRNESDLEAFLDHGGRTIILRDRKLESLDKNLGLRAIQTFRSGRRKLALAQRLDPLPRREGS